MTALAVRPWQEGDRQFVYETFLDSFRTSHSAGLIAMDDWKDVMGPQVRKLLARPRVEVTVAYNPSESGGRADLYGWLAVERGHEAPLVLYCYLKQPYRRLGIARRLFKAAGIDPSASWMYAAKTPIVAKLGRAMDHARWMPLPARFPSPQ